MISHNSLLFSALALNSLLLTNINQCPSSSDLHKTRRDSDIDSVMAKHLRGHNLVTVISLQLARSARPLGDRRLERRGGGS
jgi:hypothetical protein